MKAGNLFNIYDGKPLETLKIITSIEQIDNLAQGTVCFYVGNNVEIEISDQGNICTGDFFKIKESNIIIINRSVSQVVIPSSSSSEALSEEETPLTLIAETAGSTVTLNANGSPTTSGLLYRTNMNDEWQSYTCGISITLTNIDDYVQFANTKSTLSASTSNYVQFSMTGSIKAYGNIQSMLSYDSEKNIFIENVEANCYINLFYGCNSLTTAPILPVITLKSRCYYGMFQNCKSLIAAPELPATELDSSCYQNMFNGCTSLITMPSFQAETVASSCCVGMMRGCTKLSTVPNKLPAMEMKSQCYTSMFYGCTSLTKAPELPATTLFKSCYSTMFRGCTSLTKAPELPATTLAESCYSAMFRGCTSLTKAPELPATTLATSCYANMFYDCKKINYIKTNFTSWLDGATSTWLYNVASTGTFICPSTLDTTQSGTSYIPKGWTVEHP